MKKYIYIKDILDFMVAIILTILLLPLLLCIMFIIKIDSKGPIFFKQKRIGKDKREFYIFKFRTMKIDTPKDMPTHLLDQPEVFITRVGKLLRKSSLDELPQLFNILMGQMSFIGPRPALWNQYDLIEERDKVNANAVKPGITGLAQVNGRDELSIEEKAKYDGEYIEDICMALDAKIAVKTIINVLSSKGIVEGNSRDNGLGV